jgi:16S rRNA (guanine527-N7)-methyltransferase
LSPHREALRAAGAPTARLEALSAYLDLLAAWNRRVNLTAARTPAARVAVLVAPVLPLLPLLLPGSLLDVGSGNGSPGLVLALLDPSLPTTLLEPRSRRWAFLREAARAGGRADVEVRRERHDAYRGAPAANVTVRALRLPVGELARLIAPGGQALLFAPSPGARPLPGGPAGAFVFRPGDVPRET